MSCSFQPTKNSFMLDTFSTLKRLIRNKLSKYCDCVGRHQHLLYYYIIYCIMLLKFGIFNFLHWRQGHAVLFYRLDRKLELTGEKLQLLFRGIDRNEEIQKWSDVWQPQLYTISFNLLRQMLPHDLKKFCIFCIYLQPYLNYCCPSLNLSGCSRHNCSLSNILLWWNNNLQSSQTRDIWSYGNFFVFRKH